MAERLAGRSDVANAIILNFAVALGMDRSRISERLEPNSHCIIASRMRRRSCQQYYSRGASREKGIASADLEFRPGGVLCPAVSIACFRGRLVLSPR